MEDLPQFDDEVLDRSKRKKCLRCTRPEKVCLCTWLPKTPVSLQSSRIIILQHPDELYRPMRTVNILESTVTEESCVIHRGRRFTKSKYPQLHQLLSQRTMLLYPSKDAHSLEEVCLSKQGFCTFIILDGTWKQAKEIYKQNPFLHDMSKALIKNANSRYLIRKQPTDNCLSTLECAAAVIKFWEHNQDTSETLMTALDAMCRMQLDHGDQIHKPASN